jgi:hypothetical protein
MMRSNYYSEAAAECKIVIMYAREKTSSAQVSLWIGCYHGEQEECRDKKGGYGKDESHNPPPHSLYASREHAPSWAKEVIV